MGFISHSSSFTRFKVMEELPADYKDLFSNEIRRYAFREIEENSDIERSSGWVNIMDILDNQFMAEEFLKNEYLTFSLRIDTRRIPSHILKQQYLRIFLPWEPLLFLCKSVLQAALVLGEQFF